MTQDQAQLLLEPHYDAICNAVVTGYRKYRKYPSRTIHLRRTRANIVNDEILAAIIQEFHGVPDTRPVEIRKKNLRFMLVAERVLLWFKKTDRLRRPKVYPTEHAKQMERGGQLNIFPDCQILVVGYLLNQDETKVIRVSISKPAGRGSRPEWYIDLEPSENEGLAVIEPGHPGTNRPRVIVKPGAIQGALLGS